MGPAVAAEGVWSRLEGGSYNSDTGYVVQYNSCQQLAKDTSPLASVSSMESGEPVDKATLALAHTVKLVLNGHTRATS